MNIYSNISEAYLGILADVYHNPDYRCSPRGQPIREKLDYIFRVENPTSDPIVTKDLDRNKVIAEYTSKEMELYNSCSNSAEDFGKASKFWLKLANKDGTINSAYGYLIWANKSHGSNFETERVCVSLSTGPTDGSIYEVRPVARTPWEWSKQALIADKDTRQAVMRFSLPEHQWVGNLDQVCTLHGNWLIRDNKLHLSIVMRSNDLMLGLVYDISWFCSLMDRMLEELRPVYPDLTKGHYTHTVHSIHVYEKDAEKILKMLGEKC